MFRFRLFGIPYAITPFFWIGSAILGSGAARGKDGLLLLAVWVACVFVSIVLHELGHALMARRFGVQPSVALYQFGGLTFLPGVPLTRGQHILVSLAGPAAGFLVYAVTWSSEPYLLRAFGGSDPTGAPTHGTLVLFWALEQMLYINGVWTLFNLLPILPLDGGQVMRDVLGPRRLSVSRMIGAVCATAVALLAALRGQYILAFFLGYLAYSNFVGDMRSLPGGVDRG